MNRFFFPFETSLVITMTKNLAKLSIVEKERFFDSFDMVQTDCDGVLWMLAKPFAGVDRSVRALRTNGKRVVFVSNNSVRSMEDYREKVLTITDHTVDDDDILHPAKLVIEYLREIKFDALCYVIGSANFKACLREAGFQVLDGPDDPVSESIGKILKIIDDGQPVKAVIVDFDYNMNNIKLLRAQMYLRHDELFITGAMDTVLPLSPRMRLIGPGNYVEILQRVADRKPIVLAKPGAHMSRLVKKMYAIEDPRRVLFVGDQLDTDVKFGHISNYQTLLVGTGGIKEEHLQDKVPDIVPDYYIEAFADLEQIVRDVMMYKARKGDKAGP
uniref:4-nitrophenylphosphatase n=1 Tax=Anopheles farauti TaxID=69004 RepID=A0A182QHD5_9DIPT